MTASVSSMDHGRVARARRLQGRGNGQTHLSSDLIKAGVLMKSPSAAGPPESCQSTTAAHRRYLRSDSEFRDRCSRQCLIGRRPDLDGGTLRECVHANQYEADRELNDDAMYDPRAHMGAMIQEEMDVPHHGYVFPEGDCSSVDWDGKIQADDLLQNASIERDEEWADGVLNDMVV
jgi:hypothetical protein